MTRTDILNRLVELHHYKSYLEIGVGNGINFSAVRVFNKVGVDPCSLAEIQHRMTSDQFFANQQQHFDLIFIDGLHEREQVDRDIENALAVLNEGGTIVLHDCNPLSESMQRVPKPEQMEAWTGDVWKSIARLRMTRSDLSVCVLDTDWGCGLIRAGNQSLIPSIPFSELSYRCLEQYRVHLLNLISIVEWTSKSRSPSMDFRAKLVRSLPSD